MMDEHGTSTVFADTCVLLNFVQQDWEHDRSTTLVESDGICLVVSEHVIEELQEVSKRRWDIYEDLLDFLVESEENVEEYDPTDRRAYFGPNDGGHVRNIQMTLSEIDDQREVLRRLRQFVRAARRRVEYLESILKANTVSPVAPLDLVFAMDSLLNQNADAAIVTDAAAWTADGGSGLFITLDRGDLLDHKDEIVDLLSEKQGPDWVIQIITPDEISVETGQEAD
jgi:hypothetical protein